LFRLPESHRIRLALAFWWWLLMRFSIILKFFIDRAIAKALNESNLMYFDNKQKSKFYRCVLMTGFNAGSWIDTIAGNFDRRALFDRMNIRVRIDAYCNADSDVILSIVLRWALKRSNTTFLLISFRSIRQL
jgi:hypothetical protein